MNYAMAEIIFMGIREYGFMHSSFQITEALIKATILPLPGVGKYLESRLKDVKHQFVINAPKALKSSRMRFGSQLGEYGFLQTPVCGSEAIIEDALFT